MEETISIKDVYGEVKGLQGQMVTLLTLATRVTDIEKEILILKEKFSTHDSVLKGLIDDWKEDRKQNTRILIYIGVIAIISGAFGNLFITKLFS